MNCLLDGEAYGYIRTSTNKQRCERQLCALREICDEVVIEDSVSARKKRRPKFEDLCRRFAAGDTLVVIAYDRAFRSVVEGLSTLDELTRRHVTLESVTEHLDPTTPHGRMQFSIILVLAEWEINNLSQRTVSGLKAAIQRGEKLGRPAKGENLKRRKRYRTARSTAAATTIATTATTKEGAMP